MSGVWHLVKRIVLISLGSLIGSIVAVVLLVLFAREKLARVTAGRGVTPEVVDAAFELMRQGRLLVSTASLVPALLLVVIGEVARIRSAAYYVVGGGIALAVMPYIARIGQDGNILATSDTLWKAFATAGFAAGLAYWLIAGRRA